MKTFKQMFTEELDSDEYVRRNKINQQVLKELRSYYNPMEELLRDISNVAILGGRGKIKDNVKELISCCKGVIETAKKLQEMS